MNAKFSRIQTRALLLALLPAAVLTVALTAYHLVIHLDALEQGFYERGRAIAREMADLAADPLAAGDEPRLLALAEGWLQRDDTVAVEIDRPGATALAMGATGGADAVVFEAPLLAPENGADGQAEAAHATFGSLRVSITDRIHLQTQQQLVFGSLGIGLLVLAVGGAMALVLAGRVIRPVRNLAQAVSRLERGELDVEVPVISRGELRTLEQAFNTMSRRLRDGQQQVDQGMERATGELLETLEALEIRNVELDLARKRALEASRAKTEFLANISHEIRTPMNGILGFARLLGDTRLDVTQQDFLQNIVASASGLMHIIDNLLDFSRLEADRMQLSVASFSLRGCVEDAVLNLVPEAHAKQLELVLLVYDDVPDVLVGDCKRLRQIITNLIGNAVKFTQQGDVVVRVMQSAGDDPESGIVIRVSDTGIGIAPDQRARLFRPFEQGSPSIAQTYGGSGLGLAISRKLAKAMGGDLRLAEHDGPGASFEVFLAMSESQEPAGPTRPPALAGARVALCDTHRLSFLALAHRLRRWGAEVIPWNDSALREEDPNLRSTAVHALVLGLSANCDPVSQETLLEAGRRICKTPLLALVSNSDTERLLRLQDLGASQCLPKPIQGATLIQALRILLAQQKAGRKITALDIAPPTPRPALTNLRVLAADDNAINLRLVTRLLTATGARPTTACDGEAVLKAMAKQRFDLLLLDIHMPVLDGLETLRRIRASGGDGARIPTIGLTADAAPDNLARMREAGFDDYLIKPLDEAQLWRIVRRVIHGGRDVRTRPWTPDTPEEVSHDPRELPVRDTNAALRTAGGNADLAGELFAAFIEDLPAQFEEMRRLQQREQWDELQETAHRLHGSAAYCGVPALKDAIRRLEAAAKGVGSDHPELDNLMDAVGAQIDRLNATQG